MSSYCTMHCYIVIYRGALCKRYKLRIVVVLLQCRSFATNAALTACAQFKSGCQIPDNQSLFQSVKGRRAILPIMSYIFNEFKSISVLPLTSHIEDSAVFRDVIEPDKSNGISKLSQAMVDKNMPVRKEKISGIIGKINRKLMIKIESAIAIFYGIA